MKILGLKLSLLLSSIAMCYGSIVFDDPVLYRSALFSGMPEVKAKNWTTSFAMRYSHGTTRDSRDSREKKCPLFDLYGSQDLTFMGAYLEGAQGRTLQHWQDTYQNPAAANAPPAPEVLPAGAAWGGPQNLFQFSYVRNNQEDATLSMHGRLKNDELAFSLRQSVFSGFFMQADLPVRRLRIDQVEYRRKGQIGVAGAHGVADLDQFITGRNAGVFVADSLPTVLEENGFVLPQQDGHPVLPKEFKQTDVPQATVSIGWQGSGKNVLGYIDGVRGSLQAGVIAPLANKKDENSILALPLGFNKHLGAVGKAQVELNVFNIVTLGSHASVRLFLKEDRHVRMKTDRRQRGWLLLGKAKASVDHGSIWDLGGYVKAERIVQGLSLLCGYTFAKQEATRLHLKDDQFLQTYAENKLTNYNQFTSKNDIINDDERLAGWEMQTLYIYAEYDAKKHTNSVFAPCIAGSYSYPLTGRRSMMTDMASASMQLGATWHF